MKAMKIFRPWRVMLCLALGLHIMCGIAQEQTQPLAAIQTQPPRHTYAPESPTYYRNTHGERERVEVYRRDPNIWVYTPDVAKRAGMPLEWASEELKGVAAAAFRLERDGAEEDCGWGGNRNACKPVYQCVLELYFDRLEHKLPWDKDALVVDVYRHINGSGAHLLAPLGYLPSEPKIRRGLARQPFADPETGAELAFDGLRVLAYDREIHGRYSFVRLEFGCIRGPVIAKPIVLQLVPKTPQSRQLVKVFHELNLPANWNLRVQQLAEQEQKRSVDFYKQTWDSINKGDKK